MKTFDLTSLQIPAASQTSRYGRDTDVLSSSGPLPLHNRIISSDIELRDTILSKATSDFPSPS